MKMALCRPINWNFVIVILGLFTQANGYRPAPTNNLKAASIKIPANIATCYTSTNYWPSYRLPNSLDNLIYIIEKIENYYIKNQYSSTTESLDAATLANAILRRFQKDGIYDSQGRELKNVLWTEAYKQDIVFSILPSFSNATVPEIPEGALTDKEKCSLHFMLSTSVNTSEYTYNYQQSYDYSSLPLYPRQNGALLAGKYGTLSGGPLLSGIAASSVLQPLTVQDLVYENEARTMDASLLTMQIDPVLASSLAGEIGQSVILYSQPPNSHAVLGPDGVWNGTVCSTTYVLTSNETTAATKAELLGAVDGMIIGYFLKNNYYSSGASTTPMLSQVLRSYYGRGLQANSVYACDRNNQVNQGLNSVQSTATGFAAIYKARGAMSSSEHQFPEDTALLGSAVSLAVSNFSSTYLSSNQFACDNNIQDLACLTENDVIVVMDVTLTSSNTNFQEQKDFIGGLIGRMGVYPNGSHIGVATFSSSNREPIPYTSNDQNGGDIRCQLQWTNTLYGGSIDAPGTIRYVQEKFRSIKNAQKNANLAKVPGKVVIFIYLQNSLSKTDEVKIAMDDLRREMPEVTTLAVGTDKNTLKNFVLNDKDIFIKTGEQITLNLDAVMKRLCTSPATLEYKDCKNPNLDTEKKLVGDAYIYPNTYQWIGISPYTFNRSSNNNAYLNFESKYGSATFCVSRSISYEAPSSECYETSTTTPYYQYQIESICDNQNPCPWIYVNAKVKTMGSTTEKCSEQGCDSWNQVKVSISHEGLKCGASQIFVAIPILIIGFVFNWISQQL